MNEKEKMLYGENYNAEDKELKKDRRHARQVCFEYNNTPPADAEKMQKIMSSLLGKHGKNCGIRAPFYCDYGYNIEVGDNFFANFNLTILDGAKVTIGNNVFIAPNVGIYTAGHPLDAERRRSGEEYAKPVSIGNDVWIGAGVSILPGVKIGDNCVIGAGSVVNKDIPDNSLAVGNPCKVIKQI